jgi:hypothetical protein
MKNCIQAKIRKKTSITSPKSTHKKDVDFAKTTKNNIIKENKEEKDHKEDKGNELDLKYCPTNATLANLLTKPLTKANIRKIRNMIKSIIDQQECVGEKHDYGTGSGTGTGTGIGSSSGTNLVLVKKTQK